MLIGRISPDGRLSARVKYDITENLCAKLNAQVPWHKYELAPLNVVESLC